MESTPISTCGVHGLCFLECNAENCTKKTVCKLCAYNSKEDIQHVLDHFDHLKDSEQREIAEFSTKTKDYEGYADLNKIYNDSVAKASSFTEGFFEGINQSKALMIYQLRESVLGRYNELTTGFEDLVKSLTEKLGSVNLQDKKCVDGIKRMKAELGAKTELLNNTESLVSLFQDSFQVASKKLTRMKIKDIVDKKFNFSGKKGSTYCELTCGGSRCDISQITNKNGSGYWTVTSNEILEGSFEVKIRIERINPSQANAYWNYGFGIMRASSQNHSAYYNDSCMLNSNCYTASQFSGSGGSQVFNRCLQNGDLLCFKREDDNNIYYALNDDNGYKLVFSNIAGPFKLVLGFGSSITEGVFEIEEFYDSSK
jgi:hypothetical protein